MKRNIKALIAAVVILALIAGLYIFAVKWQPEEEKKTEENSLSDFPEIEYLVEVDTADIEYVKFNNGAESYTIRNGETASIEGYFSNVIDTSSLMSALYDCASVAIGHKIENPKELSAYGLDKEDKYVIIKTKDGAEHKIIIGNSANFDGEFYAMNKATGEVATIKSYEVDSLCKSPSEYRSLQMCSIDPQSVKNFTIEKSGAKVLSVKYDEDYVPKNEYLSVSYLIEYPYKGVTASLDKLQELFESLSSPVAKSIVEENPKNLSSYGLDKPYSLTVTDANGTVSMKMGDYDEEGNVYMMYNNVPVVYAAQSSFYETVKETKPDEYVERFINLFTITQVSEIIIKGDTESHSLEVDEKEDGNSVYKIDGKHVTEDSFKKIYQQIIGITAAKFTKDTPKGEEKCSITFKLKDKSSKTFNYYVYDERNCIVKADNGMVCLALTESIDAIFNSLE